MGKSSQSLVPRFVADPLLSQSPFYVKCGNPVSPSSYSRRAAHTHVLDMVTVVKAKAVEGPGVKSRLSTRALDVIHLDLVRTSDNGTGKQGNP